MKSTRREFLKEAVLGTGILVYDLTSACYIFDRSLHCRVDPLTVHQTIDGFGASSAWLGDPLPPLPWSGSMPANLTDAQADLFFSPVSGIGLSLLRSRVSPDGTATDRITQLKATARGARVWASPWTPPAAWKSNKDTVNGGFLLPAHYQDYANHLAHYVFDCRHDGVDLIAISIQNEPDWKATYESCLYSSQQMYDFLPFLHNALATHGVGDCKIILPEQGKWAIDLASYILRDPVAASKVGIIACHHYAGTVVPLETAGKPLWMTEAADNIPYNGTIHDALRWGQEIHDSMVIANVSAWHHWQLIVLPWDNDNEGLTDTNGNPAKRMYVLGHWSRFVRPGFRRINATSNNSSVLVSAYKSPDDSSITIVVLNKAAAPVKSTFVVRGATSSSIQSWLTSSDTNLEQQPTTNMISGSFGYTLPPSSVLTFSGSLNPAASQK